MSQDTYTPTEASKLLGVSTKRVRQLVDEGKLEGVPDSKPLRIKAESVHNERESRGTKKPESSGLLTLSEISFLIDQAREAGERSALLAITAREESEKYLREALAQEQAERKQAQEKLLLMSSRLAELEAAEASKRRGFFSRS
jgi:excisionase family DNA binding protein